MPKFSLMILLAAEIGLSPLSLRREAAKPRKANPRVEALGPPQPLSGYLPANEAFCEITTDYVRTQARQFYL